MNSAAPESVFYTSPTERDHVALRAMARSSFSQTFSHHYDTRPFRAFLDHNYGAGGTMAQDLNDPTIQWRMAVWREQPIGYVKLTPLRAPAPTPLLGSVELQQLYVLEEWHGRDVASHLMEWALATAAAAHAPEIYLTVFDHNTRAKRFYDRYGFKEVGSCTFTMGDRVDDDRIWMRAV